jgi:hypothetical protein
LRACLFYGRRGGTAEQGSDELRSAEPSIKLHLESAKEKRYRQFEAIPETNRFNPG